MNTSVLANQVSLSSVLTLDAVLRTYQKRLTIEMVDKRESREFMLAVRLGNGDKDIR